MTTLCGIVPRFCVVLVLVVNLVFASHFRGATISWQPVNTSTVIDGNVTLPVRIKFKISWRLGTQEGKCNETVIAKKTMIGGDVAWKCLTENCAVPGSTSLTPHAVGTMGYICTAFSKANNWAKGENSFIINLPVSKNNTFFRIGINPEHRLSCCWQNTNNMDPYIIRLHTEMDFTPRPDNGKLNRSPVTDMIPIIPARSGCEHRLYIPHWDPDLDDVRCRWAHAAGSSLLDSSNTENECGTVCWYQLYVNYGAILINETCEIIWRPTEVGLYAVAVQIEDFAPGFPDKPLSETPLQFLINVTHSNLTCDQIPIFENTPLQPNCFAVPKGETFVFDIYATHVAYPQKTAKVLITTRPRGMNVSEFVDVSGKPGLKTAKLTWTPAENQYDLEHFFCFVATDEDGAGSDQQCIGILAGYEIPKITVDPSTLKPMVSFNVTTMKGVISFTQPIHHPTSPRYIRVYESETNRLVEEIDTSNHTGIEISADHLTAVVSLLGTYKPATTYYILVEQGAFVGMEGCAGGGPNADGIASNSVWTFKPKAAADCTADDNSACHQHAECIEPNCVCKVGYTGDGKVECKDINECDLNKNQCHSLATCTNTNGSFECSCVIGYTGNGVECIDIDECGIGAHNCEWLATCANTLGSYTCHCPSGYSLSGDNICQDIDECANETDECTSGFNCVNTPGSYKCEPVERPTLSPSDAARCIPQSSVAERVRQSLLVFTGTVKKHHLLNSSPPRYGVSVFVYWVYKGLLPSDVGLPTTVFVSGFGAPGDCKIDVEIGDTLVFFTVIGTSRMLSVTCFDIGNVTLESVAPVTYRVLMDIAVAVNNMKEFCGASQYGCCSDGVTVAQGMQEGCPDYSFELTDQLSDVRTLQRSSYPVDILSGLGAYNLLDDLPLANHHRCDVLNKVSFQRANHHTNLTKPIEDVLDCFTSFPKEYSILVQSMQPNGVTSYLLTLDQFPDIRPLAIRFQESSVVFEYRDIISRTKKRVEFDVDLTDGYFHRYSFGVTNSSVAMYVNCSLVGEQEISGLDRVEFKGDFVVGRKHMGTDTFTGIIEKLMFSPDPAHAEQQCLLYDFYECRPSHSLNSSFFLNC